MKSELWKFYPRARVLLAWNVGKISLPADVLWGSFVTSLFQAFREWRAVRSKGVPLTPLPLPRFYFFALLLLRTAPHYLNAWNRLVCHAFISPPRTVGEKWMRDKQTPKSMSTNDDNLRSCPIWAVLIRFAMLAGMLFTKRNESRAWSQFRTTNGNSQFILFGEELSTRKSHLEQKKSQSCIFDEPNCVFWIIYT